ncbi:MAG: DUF5784 family protein [Halolamina sp.]
MARPLRFRYAPGGWSADRVDGELLADLDANLGARATTPWYSGPDGYETRRFEMDDGSLALFCWSDGQPGPTDADGGPGAYWVGNTETPSALWRTDKYDFDEVPYPVRRWAERELLAVLHEAEPWLAKYPHVSWFFLLVFCSKDGAETTRRFFREAAAGFPDADAEAATAFYESVLQTGVLDDYRATMAGKLGTSQQFDRTRMASAMAEFDGAYLLDRAGYDVVPEIEVTTGHSLDFRAERDGSATLVEVTRPVAPTRRAVDSPLRAVRETVATKTEGQLAEHGGGATLLVDCTSFRDEAWNAVRAEQPTVGHRPAAVVRLRPDGSAEGYRVGSVPISLEPVVDWLD